MHRNLYFGRYQHYKGGIYKALNVARHSETGEELVIYQREDGPLRGMTWARPKNMFLGTVVVDGQVVPRFQYL